MSSFIIGSFLTPSFILSFTGAIVSTFSMILVLKFCDIFKKPVFSLIGISIIGAVVHNFTQLIFVFLLFIRNKNIFVLTPFLIISAVVTGWFTGVVVVHVCKKIMSSSVKEFDNVKPYSDSFKNVYIHKNSFVFNMNPALKLLVVILIIILILLTKSVPSLLVVVSTILGLIIISNLSLLLFFKELNKMVGFLLISFLFPTFFSESTNYLLNTGLIKISYAGVVDGIIYSLRLVAIILATNLLILSTSQENLIIGIKKLLAPFTVLKFPVERYTNILIISWSLLPTF